MFLYVGCGGTKNPTDFSNASQPFDVFYTKTTV